MPRAACSMATSRFASSPRDRVRVRRRSVSSTRSWAWATASRLLGYVPDPARTLAARDPFVLASGYEGLPVALMEAMAIGPPIVATDIPGVRESVQHGREALLVPVGHPELLAEALIEVAGDPDRRNSMALASRERSRSFDLRRSTREIEDIYRALVGPRRRRSAVA